MSTPRDDQKLKEKLLFKIGVADTMASHAKTVAGSLKEAADHHGQQAHYDLHEHGERVRAAGVGNDPEAEDAYCKRLMDRHRMHQTYELAAMDEARFPDIVPHDKHMKKSLSRVHPEDRAGYTWGTVHENGAPLEADDYQPRLYDPQEFLPREPDRDKDLEKVAYFTDLFNRRDPNEIDPVVLVRTEHGREILDGHHRALGAKEADRKCRAVEIGQDAYQGLKDLGYTDMDLAYAVLALADCWDAADKVKGQFDGRPVRYSGFLAYEHLSKGSTDGPITCE